MRTQCSLAATGKSAGAEPVATDPRAQWYDHIQLQATLLSTTDSLTDMYSCQHVKTFAAAHFISIMSLASSRRANSAARFSQLDSTTLCDNHHQIAAFVDLWICHESCIVSSTCGQLLLPFANAASLAVTASR